MTTYTGTSGNDTYTGTAGADTLYGLDGDDKLYGEDGDDTLLGGNGNDLLNGGAGNDVLDGGSGADGMIGGDGDDTYIVDNVGDLVGDFSFHTGNDTVKASVTYSLDALYAEGIERLILTGSAHINATGNALDNFIQGNSGNNILDGGAGADAMAGGDGDDTYIVDNVNDLVFELEASPGKDTVNASVSYSLDTPLAAGVENLFLTGTGHINGTGNALGNLIRGNSGNNILDGGAGADGMTGGDGDDTYIVDNVGDLVGDFSFHTGNDTVKASVTYSLDTLNAEGIENLILTGTAHINGTGNALDNFITGNSGNNILDGRAGADAMAGGDGNDTYIVDNINDVVFELTTSLGSDTVKASVSYSLDTPLAAGVEQLILTGHGDIDGIGNSLANALLGNSGDNFLDGKGGDDLMAGGDGNDTYVVDSAGDVVYELDGAGYSDTVRSSISFSLDDITRSGVEQLLLTGPGNLNGTGNALNNLIVGNSGNNQLSGGAGDDDLIGGDGNDVLNGGDGHDILLGDAGADTLNGGAGNDQLEGGAGNDSLNGGTGNDIYFAHGAFGADVITDTDTTVNADELHFTSASYNALWFSQSGSNLLISEVGTSNQITVQNWFTSANNRIESIYADGSGMSLQSSAVANLVSVMAGFAPQNLSGATGTLAAARDAAWATA